MLGDFSAISVIALFILGYAAATFLIFNQAKQDRRKLCLLAPVLLYGASLAFPVFGEGWPGYGVLAFGWLGLVGSLVGWYANPFFLLSFVGALINNRKMAIY